MITAMSHLKTARPFIESSCLRTKSQYLARKEIAKLRDVDGGSDPLLIALCTTANVSGAFSWLSKITPNSNSSAVLFHRQTVDIRNRFTEAKSCSVQADFLVYRSRLAVLQQYNLQQQPCRVRDLWLDRREPLKWYAFWAVLWIGGFSILLALQQLGVGLGQLSTTLQKRHSVITAFMDELYIITKFVVMIDYSTTGCGSSNQSPSDPSSSMVL